MSHPGFGFTRRSYHTLSPFACPRRGYFAQLLELRRGPGPGGWDGPLNVGKLFHSLLELHRRKLWAKVRGKSRGAVKLFGTDGQPLCETPQEVVAYYESQGYSQKALFEAEDLWAKYRFVYPDENKDALIRQLIGVEVDVQGDLRNLLPPDTDAPELPYAAQYDAVIQLPGVKAVASLESKGLSVFAGNTLFLYLNSGQTIGQCAVWNSRADLVERWGPMTSVWIDITFKTGTAKREPTWRESLFIPAMWQRQYAQAHWHRTLDLEASIALYDDAQTQRDAQSRRDGVAAAWPVLGMINGDCVDMTRTCEFQGICFNNNVVSELYQITERGKARAKHDGVVRIESNVETYTTA